MLNPLIVLDNYMDLTSKKCLLQHLEKFKNLGYKTVLLDMNKEVTYDEFLSQLRQNMTMPMLGQQSKSAFSALYDLTLGVTDLGMQIKFIDPQAQAEAHQEAMRGTATVESLKSRDRQMHQTIVNEYFAQGGGFIVIVGFTHKYLVDHLQSSQINAKFAILGSFEKSVAATNELYWQKLKCDDYRAKFYNAEVKCPLNPLTISFESLENILELTPKMQVGNGYILSLFDAKLKVKLKYALDEYFVLSASGTMKSQQKLSEVVDCLKTEFPGLYFHAKQNPPSLELNGLNLPEHEGTYRSAFKLSLHNK